MAWVRKGQPQHSRYRIGFLRAPKIGVVNSAPQPQTQSLDGLCFVRREHSDPGARRADNDCSAGVTAVLAARTPDIQMLSSKRRSGRGGKGSRFRARSALPVLAYWAPVAQYREKMRQWHRDRRPTGIARPPIRRDISHISGMARGGGRNRCSARAEPRRVADGAGRRGTDRSHRKHSAGFPVPNGLSPNFLCLPNPD